MIDTGHSTAQPEDAVDREYPTDIEYGLQNTVFSWIEDRFGALWKEES